MRAEDDREIGHFKTGRYPTLLSATQERLIARLEAAEAQIEEYRKGCWGMLSADWRREPWADMTDYGHDHA